MRTNPAIRVLLVLEMTTIFAVAIFPMMPVYARDVLDVGATGFGILSASLGAGFMVGSVIATTLGGVSRKFKIMLIFVTLWDGPMAIFAFSSIFPLSVTLVFIMGIGGAVWNNFIITALQTVSDDEIRGRVMSIHTIVNQFVPLGWMISGTLASVISIEFPLLMGAALGTPVAVLIYLRSPALRSM